MHTPQYSGLPSQALDAKNSVVQQVCHNKAPGCVVDPGLVLPLTVWTSPKQSKAVQCSTLAVSERAESGTYVTLGQHLCLAGVACHPG